MVCKNCPHSEYKDGFCYRCYRAANDPIFAALWKDQPAALTVASKLLLKSFPVCMHLSARVRDERGAVKQVRCDDG